MLFDDVQHTMTAALKKGDAVVVETLRYLIAAVRNDAIAKYGAQADKVTDDDVLSVVKKQVKTHRESIDAFTKAGRTDLAEKEKAQLAVLETYLPAELSDAELKALLVPVAAAGGDFGPMMGRAMAAVQGKADGRRVSAMLKELTAA